MLEKLLDFLKAGMTDDGLRLPLFTVRSKSLVAIGYDDRSRVLCVEYFNGVIYEIMDFPKADFERLLEADDLDEEFSRIVLPEFKFKKVGRAMPVIQ